MKRSWRSIRVRSVRWKRTTGRGFIYLPRKRERWRLTRSISRSAVRITSQDRAARSLQPPVRGLRMRREVSRSGLVAGPAHSARGRRLDAAMADLGGRFGNDVAQAHGFGACGGEANAAAKFSFRLRGVAHI